MLDLDGTTGEKKSGKYSTEETKCIENTLINIYLKNL